MTRCAVPPRGVAEATAGVAGGKNAKSSAGIQVSQTRQVRQRGRGRTVTQFARKGHDLLLGLPSPRQTVGTKVCVKKTRTRVKMSSTRSKNEPKWQLWQWYGK